jgi:type II secretory pathway component PulK
MGSNVNLGPIKLPKTHAGFPVESADDGHSNKQSGIALLMAIMIVSIVFTFSADLVISSRVAIENAMRSRDDVKAEYMAKSAFNLGAFLLSMDFGIDMVKASGKLGPAEKMTDSIGDIWSMLNGLPIGGGTVEMMAATQESFDLNAVNDDKVLATLKQFDGEFILNIEDESSKINVNYCWEKMAGINCIASMAMVEALMNCPAEKAFLRNKNLDPKEMAFRIRDYIDSDKTATTESGMSDENDAYQKKDPPYSAKNGQLDSVDELRMIEGWDDEIHAVFSPYITTFPFQRREDSTTEPRKVNINTASRELLGCLFPNAKAECTEKFELSMKQRSAEKETLVGDKGQIAAKVREMFCYAGGETGGADRTTWFDTRSDVYSIKAQGVVGDQTKTIHAVIERGMPDKAKKLERSFTVLHWKIM